MADYKLLIEFSSIDELKGYVADLGERALPVIKAAGVPQVKEPPVETGKSNGNGFKKKEDSEVAADEPSVPPLLKKKPGRPAKSDTVDETPNPVTPAVEAIPYKVVMEATMAFNKVHGREPTLAVLKEFGAMKNATELKVGQYQAYLDRLQELTDAGSEGALA